MSIKHLALSLLFVSMFAQADSLVLHAYTKHPSDQPWMQNNTPGIGYITENGATFGMFCNSYSASKLKPEFSDDGTSLGRRNCANSYYLGKVYSGNINEYIKWDVTTIGVVGYGRGIKLLGEYVQPLVAPGIQVGMFRASLLAPRTIHGSLIYNF